MDFWLSILCPFFYLAQLVPKGFFLTSRGLRQGDSLSPFLFTLVADSLGQIFIIAEAKGLFDGFQGGSHKINVSHL